MVRLGEDGRRFDLESDDCGILFALLFDLNIPDHSLANNPVFG